MENNYLPFRAYRANSADMISEQSYTGKVAINPSRTLTKTSHIDYVIKPQLNLSDQVSVCDNQLADQKAKLVLERFFKDGLYLKDRLQSYYIYKISSTEHSQIGLVCLMPIKLYQQQQIIRHEQYIPDALDKLKLHLSIIKTQVCPIVLSHDNIELPKLIQEYITKKNHVLLLEGDITHTLWKIDNNKDIERFKTSLNTINNLNIVDGHHRLEALSKIQEKKSQKNINFMSVLFSKLEIQFDNYHRLIEFDEKFNSKILSQRLSDFGFIKASISQLDDTNYIIFQGKFFILDPIKFNSPTNRLDSLQSYCATVENLLQDIGIYNFEYKIWQQLSIDEILSSKNKILIKFADIRSQEILTANNEKPIVLPAKTTCSKLKPANGLILYQYE